MKAIGIILAGGNSEMRMGELTAYRAAAAMPVGASYRAIDFPLSSMTASGIGKIAVITQYNSRSLHDHLVSSKWWDLGRKKGGLFVLSPYTSKDNSSWFRGTADSIYQNISFLERSNEPYVAISSGDAVYKMNYKDIIAYHKEKGADITIVYKRMDRSVLYKYGVMQMDEDGRIFDFEEKPLDPQSDCASLGVYIIGRELLIDLLENAESEGRYDLVRDIIVRLRRRLKIYGYEFNGYWSSVGSGTEDYYRTNMDFLNKDIRDMFTKQAPYIDTKPKDEPPVKYNINAEVSDSVIGSGAIINGKVDHSVIFRRVFVGDRAVIKNSILMEGCYIGDDCVIENAILDKNVTVTAGKKVSGADGAPFVLSKNTVI
ncbi:MAG: glucose-1-phosphate adenylyltransferase subunit GlgD [Clostridia bacterium]|nr:glucose-1-phosphate adenylyltransferase subunit GlgD [Clostridia bacterium]